MLRNFADIMEMSPKMIYSDQEPAIIYSIKDIFPDTIQRLCGWHIVRNMSPRFKYLLSGSEEDKTVYEGLMNMPFFEDEAELLHAFRRARHSDKINEDDKKYIDSLYEKRRSYGVCYLKTQFSAGINTTGRIESIHSQLKVKLTSSSRLQEVFMAFDAIEATQADKFSKELNSKNLDIKSNSFLQELEKYYTPYAVRKLAQHLSEVFCFQTDKMFAPSKEVW